MNLQKLRDVLRGNESPEILLNEIDREVNDYREAFRKRGSSRPIHATNDNFHFVVGRDEVKKLCSLFLGGTLDQWQLQYLSNAIDLSSSFAIEDDRVRDAIFQLADPEVNLPLNTNNVAALCESL
jgi:hypothetical protein